MLPALAGIAAGVGVVAWLLGSSAEPPPALLPIVSPRTGPVGEIRVREGERIAAGAPILLLDPAAAAPSPRLQALLEQSRQLRTELTHLPQLQADRIGLLRARLASAQRETDAHAPLAGAEFAAWESELSELLRYAREREQALHDELAAVLAAIELEAERIGLFVRASTPGTVIRLHAQRGQQLREGQTVAELHAEPLPPAIPLP